MQLIQSFIPIAHLIDNTTDVTAPFGELSDYSRSFAKDKGVYSSSDYPGIQAVVFDSSESGETLAVSEDQKTDMLKVATYISDLIKINGIPLNDGDLAEMIDDNLNIDDLTLVEVESIIDEGGIRCPDKVSWTSNNTRFSIWFHDESFRHQYLNFLIEVTLPVESVDDLLRVRDEVETHLRSVVTISQLQNDRPHDGVPTKTLIVEHQWLEKDNPAVTINMPFGLNAYGQRAFSVDEQRKALADYILTNSSYDRITWSQIFPSIFKTNEVYIIPIWDNVSVPDMTMIGSIYSPVLKTSKALTIGNRYCFGYETSHINQHLEFMPIAYKSLAAVTVGSPTNTNDQYSFTDTFSEYAFIHAHSQDYRRLSDGNKEFMRKLYELVILAEHFTLTSPLPSDVSQIERNGYYYLTRAVGGLSIIVITKLSYMLGEGYSYEPAKTYDFLGEHEC